ncbi:HNH endonuclease [Flagellimonas amoyensis]|uniref:HNH endonuclease n=1 Tax=Flagellimonas amoyensis TaxID=2169401 RepID=UPI000D3916C3|nr:HNH endonuclease [Allomuricauda amoyensis]
MAVYNTSSDSANTAIRAFLTKVGEYYWGKSFNTGSGNSKKIFEQIKSEVFGSKCAYCGVQSNKLQIEHLIMFNRAQYGLHHPGNIVPACQSCNKRRRDDSSNYLNWEEHLEQICRENDDLNSFFERKKRIQTHMQKGKFRYPELNEAEQHAIRVIANSLYENIKTENDKALKMYQELDSAFVKKITR